MNRIFGKAKEKAPPPDMTTVIKGVNKQSYYSIFIFQLCNIKIQ